MYTLAISFLLLSSLARSHANSPSPTTPQTFPATAVQIVTYYEPVSTLPPLEDGYVPQEHLELRQAAAAGAAAAQPVAGAAAGAAGAAGVAGAAGAAAGGPAVGVGGAGAVPAAAQPASTNPGQLSPVTTVNVFSVVGGVTKQVPIVYTQKFSSIPSQGPTPASGAIGMGTLTGKIGVVNTAEAKKGSAPGRAATLGFGGIAVIAMGLAMALA